MLKCTQLQTIPREKKKKQLIMLVQSQHNLSCDIYGSQNHRSVFRQNHNYSEKSFRSVRDLKAKMQWGKCLNNYFRLGCSRPDVGLIASFRESWSLCKENLKYCENIKSKFCFWFLNKVVYSSILNYCSFSFCRLFFQFSLFRILLCLFSLFLCLFVFGVFGKCFLRKCSLMN